MNTQQIRDAPCPAQVNSPSEVQLALSKQQISGRNVDAQKLVIMLEQMFAGCYEVSMMHNTYSIQAPRELSITEISRCRR
ncbi:hypothetical protein LZ30DRAFT_600800 [Colletotrichum cereale]|nr:hypothetical protein LZ30DRAFT_600800 [Colletotrichum cereale]